MTLITDSSFTPALCSVSLLSSFCHPMPPVRFRPLFHLGHHNRPLTGLCKPSLSPPALLRRHKPKFANKAQLPCCPVLGQSLGGSGSPGPAALRCHSSKTSSIYSAASLCVVPPPPHAPWASPALQLCWDISTYQTLPILPPHAIHRIPHLWSSSGCMSSPTIHQHLRDRGQTPTFPRRPIRAAFPI